MGWEVGALNYSPPSAGSLFVFLSAQIFALPFIPSHSLLKDYSHSCPFNHNFYGVIKKKSSSPVDTPNSLFTELV